MALYNLTAITAGNETGLLTLVQGVNTYIMGGWLGILFIIGISAVMLIAFLATTGDLGKGVAATSFVAFALSLSLAALNLLRPLDLFIVLIVAGVSIAVTWGKS